MNPIFESALILLLFWNLVVFFMMGVDKRKAKKSAWRIPERMLLLCSFFCGALGGFLGMRVFHHKTRHKRFSIGLPVMLILQLALGLYLTFRFLFDNI